jgi:glycosyltransferase involved in cell wall biosynthesis
MESSPKISVIIPVYNTEKYLQRCIESVLKQTFDNFELLLINDGSIDNSGLVCNKYAEQDTRVRVFHKENGGVSTARNFGIEQARGKYITFVDSDDWVEEKFLSSFFISGNEYLEKTFVICGILKDSKHTSNILHTIESNSVEKENFNSLFLDYNLYKYGYAVAKLYNNRILQNYNIRFNKKLSNTEDLLFMLEYIQYIDKVQFLSSFLYHYVDYDDHLSLSKKYYSYDAEYEAFNELKTITTRLSENFNLSTIVQQKTNEELGQKLFRVIYSLYRPRSKKEFATRIELLTKLCTNDNKIYLKSIKSKDRMIMNNIILHFFRKRHIKFTDTVFSILFMLRFYLENIIKKLNTF